MPTMTLPSDYQTALLQAKQKQALAQALQQQAFQPIESADSGVLKAPVSWTQGLAKAMQTYASGKLNKQATTDVQDATAQRNQMLAQTMKNAFEPKSIPGKEAQIDDQGGIVAPGIPASTRQPTPQEISQALLANPETMNLGGEMMIKDVEGRGLDQRARDLAKYKQELSMDPAYIAAQKEIKSAGASPYYNFLPTSGGYAVGNARTGNISGPAIDTTTGKPLIRATDDPNLQANISYGKKAGEQTGDADVQQHETAIASLENINKIDQLLTHLKKSDAITGMGSDFFKNIERAKVMVTNSEKAGKKVSDTELLDTMMGSEVFPLIKSLGIGARGMDTPAEREFMRSVLTGQTNLNKQTLIRMAEIRKDIANRAIKRWNDRVGTGELDRYFQTTGRPKGPLSTETSGAASPAPTTQKSGFGHLWGGQ